MPSNPHNKPSPNQQPCPTCAGTGAIAICQECDGSGKAKGVSEDSKPCLIINSWNSRCANCNLDADPKEKRHTTVLGYSEENRKKQGCGIEWKYVASEYMNMEKRLKQMRPDLEHIELYSLNTPEALPNNNGSERQDGTDAKPGKYRCDDCGYLHPQRCELKPEPKEPTKSQSFEDELEPILDDFQDWCQQNEAYKSSWQEMSKAITAIKATVEKHYQIKEEE